MSTQPLVSYSIPPQDGSSRNGIVLVGEAPGAEEERMGRPFVGRSGRLLDEALHSAGIERERTIVANTFRLRPQANKVGYFFTSRRAAVRDGIDIAEELGRLGGLWCCIDYAGEVRHLHLALAEWHAEQQQLGRGFAVVALGRTAMWALTGEDCITAKAGQQLPAVFNPSMTVIPTFHPSFILRGNWSKQLEWIGHLRLAQELASMP